MTPVPNTFPQSLEARDVSYRFWNCSSGTESQQGRWARGESPDGHGSFQYRRGAAAARTGAGSRDVDPRMWGRRGSDEGLGPQGQLIWERASTQCPSGGGWWAGVSWLYRPRPCRHASCDCRGTIHARRTTRRTPEPAPRRRATSTSRRAQPGFRHLSFGSLLLGAVDST